MTNKEIQASDEEIEQFNISQNGKCVLAEEEKLNELKAQIEVLTKEIAEMKELIEIQYAENQTLGNNNFELLKKLGTYNEQIEQLQQAYTITVDKSVIREQELEAQIEKMKNCYNCKHNNEQDAEFCCNCDRPYEGETIKDEWEFAE